MERGLYLNFRMITANILIMVQCLADKSGLKTRFLWHSIVSSLVKVCPYLQFVLENCHGTSV